MKQNATNNGRDIAYRRYIQFVVMGIIVTVILAFIGFFIYNNSSSATLFDMTSFIAALISIEVGILALAYAWYVNKKSATQLNEIQNANERANKINLDNQNSLQKITEQVANNFAEARKEQAEILKIISAMQLQNPSNFSSESERTKLENELKQRRDVLEQINKEGNVLHQLFIKSLH